MQKARNSAGIEQVLYAAGPSQMVNFNTFSICGVIFIISIFAPTLWHNFFSQHYPQHKAIYMLISKLMFILPLIYAPYSWLSVKSHKYKITTERFIETTGILSRHTNELELFRIKDISFFEPFFLRLFSCGHIIMDTSDKTTPVVALRAIKNAKPVMEILRTNISIMRTKKGVREIEM